MPPAAQRRYVQMKLRIEAGGRRWEVAVSRWPFTIGRSEDCDASIADARISRMHARLAREDGEYYIEDAGSRRGTFVNGRPCERERVEPGAEITLGVPGVRLLLLEGAPARNSDANVSMLLDRISLEPDKSELQKLRLLLEAARTLNTALLAPDVLRAMLDVALRLTGAERGFVYLKEKDGTITQAFGLDSAGQALTADASVSHSVVEEAMTTAAEFITSDATLQTSLAERESIVLNELRTVVALPLRARRASKQEAQPAEQPVEGVLYLDSRSVARDLTGVSHDVLRALAGECAAVLESARLAETEQAARQYRQEMEIAAAIQRSLVSATEVRCGFALATGRSVPCWEVGGDFFDVQASEETISVIVADVSGKGIPAALLASVIHGMFYAQISSGMGLAEAAGAINRFLCTRMAGRKYATLLAAQLHKDGLLEIVNCGHVPAILAEDGAAVHIKEGDLPVGLMAEAGFHTISRKISCGARLCILTDGISESENSAGEEFGSRRVEPCLALADPVGEIMASLEEFCGPCEAQDDRTVVVLERTA